MENAESIKMESHKYIYSGALVESQVRRRNSLVPQTKRESLQGSISSRRNSHCSIIQTSDHVVLVECRNDPLTNTRNINHKHINDIVEYVAFASDDDKDSSTPSFSPSSSPSLDLDANIKQIEETQERINTTLANLWKLKNQDKNVQKRVNISDAETGDKKREK